MADLLDHLTRQDVRTIYSWRGERTTGYVMFASAMDFELGIRCLVRLAEAAEEPGLHGRIIRLFLDGSLADEAGPDRRWTYDVQPQTRSRDGTVSSPVFDYTVRIPVEDVALLHRLCCREAGVNA